MDAHLNKAAEVIALVEELENLTDQQLIEVVEKYPALGVLIYKVSKVCK